MFKKYVLWRVFGGRGARNRVRILDLINDRPYNCNQLTVRVGLNYRVTEYHLRVLMKHDLVEISGKGWGKLYCPTMFFSRNREQYNEIRKKLGVL